MVSDKAIVVLIIIAILLSTVSIIFTLSSTSSFDRIPQINEEKIPDVDKAQVSLIINPQPNTSGGAP